MTEIGATPIAQSFYAGRYTQLLEQTYDGDAGEGDEADLCFVVGALTFVDRVDEARALFEGWLAKTVEREPRTLAACRFFLGLAAARAGYFDRSFAILVRDALRARHHADPWVRALVFQGLACQCYFTGRYPLAARNALRALQAAHEARFLYAAMLGTDMRGHSLVQMGQLQRGIALLEQAKKQAHRLGLANNAFAVDTSIATYATRFVPHGDALERVEALLRRRAHDSYSRRSLLTEAAVQRALRGRRSEAVDALQAADRDALRGDTRRGKITSLLARLWVTRWQHGPAACGPLVEDAQQLVEPRDVAFVAELLGFEIIVARSRADTARESAALARLRELWRTTHHAYARAALDQFEVTRRASAFDEDGVTPVLRAVAQRDLSALSRIVSLGIVGPLPELFGLTPGKRIILVPSEELLILEDHGDVIVRHRPPRWCPLLLRILSSGDATKEKIVAGLWGLRGYHPEIHDPPVRTAIHRLRSYLQPYGAWVAVGDEGYRTTVPVHLIDTLAPGGLAIGADPAVIEPALVWDEAELATTDSARAVLPAPRLAAQRVTASPVSGEITAQLVYERLAEMTQATAPQLSRALEVSQSTVVRALRVLLAERRVERIGFARATRYRPL